MKTIENSHIEYRRIILRADLNVPLVNGRITDHSRIDTIVPSIKKLTMSKNKIFILAHFGRPNGTASKQLSTRFLCKALKQKLGTSKIHFLKSFDRKEILKKQKEMNSGEVCLFENVRFFKEEESNDLIFSKNLSSCFEIYVNEAFSASHRVHSSIVGFPNFLPSFAGLNFVNEINNLNRFLIKAKKPNLAIIGGSKISTKIKVINHLINLFDSIIIGGAMANTFLSAKKFEIGKSIYEKKYTEIADEILMKAKKKNCKIVLPIDAVCSKKLENNISVIKCDIDKIPINQMVLDIGEKTINLISSEIDRSHSVLWNGPLGAFEHTPFDRGSIEIANKIKKSFKELKIDSLAGGGDTLSAINLAKAKDGFNYLSNAGGAFLEWLEGNKSPGYLALEKNKL